MKKADFVAGMQVALINRPRFYRDGPTVVWRDEVQKINGNGHVVLKDKRAPKFRANGSIVGQSQFRGDNSLEPWTPELEAEVETAKQRRHAVLICGRLEDRFKTLRRDPEEAMKALQLIPAEFLVQLGVEGGGA